VAQLSFNVRRWRMAGEKAGKGSLGRQMKNGREKQGMGIGDLARETGVLPAVLAGVEADLTVPPVSLVLQLSRVLKLNMDELETEEEIKATRRRFRSHKKGSIRTPTARSRSTAATAT
jgi:ribosome-binding protein aMBF1 (putative translation factor)